MFCTLPTGPCAAPSQHNRPQTIRRAIHTSMRCMSCATSSPALVPVSADTGISLATTERAPAIMTSPCILTTTHTEVMVTDRADLHAAAACEDIIAYENYSQASCLRAEDELQLLGSQARELIDLDLGNTGALLLRGIPFSGTARAASAFIKGLGFKLTKNQQLPQTHTQVTGLDSITVVPSSLSQSPCSALAHEPAPSSKVLLLCVTPAPVGGDILLANASSVYQNIPQSVIALFEQRRGLKYTRVYPSATSMSTCTAQQGRTTSWQAKSGCNHPSHAQQFFQRKGYTTKWTPDGSLVVSNTQPAVVPHPVSGQPLWFNWAHTAAQLPDSVTFGNGAPIPREVLAIIEQAREAATRMVRMEAGDVLVLDSNQWMHGRTPFEGSDRFVVTLLTQN